MSLLKRWRYILLATLAVLALGAMAACGDDDDNGGSNTPSGSAAPSGTGAPSDAAPDSAQKITINLRAEPDTIDPQAQSYTYEATVVKNTYLTLFDQDPQTSQLTPAAAEEMPSIANGGISADNLTYTIKLKSGLVWSDGTPLTAQDFVYGIMRGYDLNVSGKGYGGFFSSLKGAGDALALDPASATYKADIQAALKDSVVAVDNQTLKVLAEAPSVSFLSNFVLPITAAVKQSNVEALADTFGTPAGAAQMITSGPFTVTDWVPKDHLTMTRNEKYTAGHKAYLKTVVGTFVEDTNQAYNAFEAGQTDEAPVPPSVYGSLQGDSRLHQEAEFGTRWVTVDVTIPPWDKPDFVIAINQATDRDTIVPDVYQGIRQPWVSPCAAAVLNCQPELFDNLKYDLDKAKASALKAYPDGNIPEITLETVDDPTTKALVTRLQESWQQIPGVKVTIKTTDQTTLRADMKNHISGTQITGWGMDFADPTDLWSIKTTEQVGANNLGFYSRPGYDDLEHAQDKEFDPTKRKDLLKKLQEFYVKDPADITFAVQLRTNIWNPKVKGIINSPFDYEVIGDQRMVEIYVSK